jgi:glucokinase
MAAVDRDGSILTRFSRKTPRDCESIVKLILETAEQCRQAAGGAIAFGIAAPATVSSSEGVIRKSPNLPTLDGLRLAEILASSLSLPVTLENDGTSAALGENWLGASKGIANSICVTLGTGVGGGIIIENMPIRGVDGTAGEIGHICVEPQGAPCGCGSRGCVEQYSSVTGIQRMLHELGNAYPASMLSGCEDPAGLDVYNAGREGDALALEIFLRMGTYLGIALADLVNVLNPEVIVIGGGLSAAWELFIEHTRLEIQKRAFQEPAERATLVRAKLGDDAGILGVARLALAMRS